MALFGDTKKKEASAKRHTGRARAAKPAHGTAHDVIRAPWFSEKALLATERGVYAFVVSARATKADIAGAVKEIYGVAPRKIRIVNLPGKAKALRSGRGAGRRSARCKAYVYLAAGDSIQFV